MGQEKQTTSFDMNTFILSVSFFFALASFTFTIVSWGNINGRMKVIEWSVGDLEQFQIDFEKYRSDLYDRVITEKGES